MLVLPLMNPVASDAATRLSGAAYFDPEVCPGPPAGYDDFTDYPGLVLTGSLDGCLYTKVLTVKETPGGVYLESGEEVVVATFGGESGIFATTYKFEGKYSPTGEQQHGRCQHPIVEGSGTGVFEGVDGRLDFKDIIEDTGTTYEYRGHLKMT